MTIARAIAITASHTATYVAAKLIGSFQEVLAELGLTSAYRHDWTSVEAALTSWMEEGSLRKATIEVWDSRTDDPITRFDYPLRYDASGTSGEEFRQDMSTTRNAARRAALGGVPPTAQFRVVVDTAPWARSIPGWSGTTYRDTTGLSRRSMGEVASAPGIRAELEFWVRR